MATDPQKPTAPMPMMVVAMGLALTVIYAMAAHDYGSTAATIVVACCAPFVLYWLISNRSDDGTHFLLDKHPAASLACWARGALIFCMVVAFLFAQPGLATRSTGLVIAGLLLLLLLATPRWGSRFVPLAWAVMAVQFDLPRRPLTAWLFVGSLIVVVTLAVRRARRQGNPKPGTEPGM